MSRFALPIFVRWTLCVTVSLGCGAAPGVESTQPEATATDPTESDASGSNHRLSVGWTHTCAITASRGVTCWGRFFPGEPYASEDVGASSHEIPAGPTAVAGVTEAVEIRSGAGFACVRHARGPVSCWGAGDWPGTPTPIPGVVDAVALTAGLDHACALRAEGRVSCWGPSGELADLPRRVPFLEATAGSGVTCARPRSGAIRCWPHPAGEESVTLLEEGSDVVEIAMPRPRPGLIQACVRRTDGSVACMIWSQDGVQIYGALDTIVATSMSASATRGCVVLDSSELLCWGDMGSYLVPEVDDAIEVARGPYHACVRRRGGRVSCQGNNSVGQAGPVPLLERWEAAAVPGVEGARHVFVEGGEVCAWTGENQLRCWGGGSTPLSRPPRDVPNLVRLFDTNCWGVEGGRGQCGDVEMEIAPNTSALMRSPRCAIVGPGELRCWSDASDEAPEAFATLDALTAIVPWGSDEVGMLHRDGTIATDHRRPRRVEGVSGAVEIAGSGAHLCARTPAQILCARSTSEVESLLPASGVVEFGLAAAGSGSTSAPDMRTGTSSA